MKADSLDKFKKLYQPRDSSAISGQNLVHFKAMKVFRCAFEKIRVGFFVYSEWTENPCLSTFKEKDCNLSQIKINEMPRFVGNIWAEVSSNDTMPRRIVFFVKLFLDVSCNVLFNVVFFECLSSTVNSILLHFLGHVRIFYYCLSVRHFSVRVCFLLFKNVDNLFSLVYASTT